MPPLMAMTILILTTTSVAGASADASRATSGGTVTFAMPPGNEPNMILPFPSSGYIGFQIPDFQYQMYPPLYWYNGSSFALTDTKSLAYLPTYNATDTAVTVKLKPWYWSDGEKLSPTDVAFFMGLVTVNKLTWWGYTPGFFPQNVKSTSYTDAADSFTLHFKGRVNPTWFTDNQLSIMQPMPLAWDVSGPGKKADCSAEAPKLEATACVAVHKYLIHEATTYSTYATNPLWQVVDGPFKIHSYSSGGTTIVLVPNTKYSGRHKPKISALDLRSFTSDAAEYDVLKSGTSITVGFLPFTDAPTKPSNKAVGANPLPGYTLDPWVEWADNFMIINFNNPTIGPIEHQPYFRQAFQSLIDTTAWIRVAFRGYANADYGTVPSNPATEYLTKYQASDPYPFSVDKARSYFTSHGWTIPKTGPATCTSPGTKPHDCGAGIRKGKKLTMDLGYPSGNGAWTIEMETLISSARKVGLDISVRSLPEDTIFAQGVACKPTQSACKWQAFYYGGPASLEPYWYPTASGLYYICGSLGNSEGYCNSTLDAHYAEIYNSTSKKALSALQYCENFIVKEAITPFAPVPDEQLTEVSDKLGGFTQSGTAAITPQDWYFKS